MGPGILSAATAAGSTLDAPAWITILVAVIGSAVFGNIIVAVIARLRETTEVRRDRYAHATQLLVARIEFPYRIRRRTSDEPETLSALANRGHELQEQLAEARAWITSESPALGDLYGQVLSAIDALARPAAADAWRARPVTKAADMNVGEFGPMRCQPLVDIFQCSVRYRFGWHRTVMSNKRLAARLAVRDLPITASANGPEPNGQ